MKSEDIYTVGDLIKFLQTCDPELLVRVWDHEWDQDNPLQYIKVIPGAIIIFD